MVLVFRTSVKTEWDVIKLKPETDKPATKIKWSFDLEYCDNILRVDSSEVAPDQIISLLRKRHYDIRELGLRT